MYQELKSCPFCDNNLDLADGETLYPNGTGWVQDPESNIRYYRRHKDVSPSNWCYTVHCPTMYSGCGAEISGDSQQEAIDKWNRRAQ